MNGYDACSKSMLPRNTPVIMRVDGRAFHTFTRRFKRPFDLDFKGLMDLVAINLCQEISGARIAYMQSDEINILIYPGIYQDSWFGNNVQKMTSISASLAAAVAGKWVAERGMKDTFVTFDSRVFSIPEKDVCNYFIWRQRDWERNSLQMYCRAFYSQKEMQNKNNANMHEMLHEKGENWDKLPPFWKRGRCLNRVPSKGTTDGQQKYFWALDDDIPVFTKSRNYIEDIIVAVNEV